MKRKALIWRILPPLLLIPILSLVAEAWFSLNFLRDFDCHRREEDLCSMARLVAADLGRMPQPLDPDAVDALCKSLGRAADRRLTVILPSGAVAGDTLEDPADMANHGGRPEVIAARKTGSGVAVRFSETLKDNRMYCAVPVGSTGGDRIVVRASVSISDIDAALEATRQRIILAGGVAALIAAVFSIVVSRTISRPLGALRRAAGFLAQGQLKARLPSSEITEIDVLADALNRMADQLNERIAVTTRQRDEQEALLSCMVEGVLAVNTNRCLIRANGAAEEMLKLDADACGRPIDAIVENPDLIAIIDRTLSCADVVEGDVFLEESGRHLQVHGTVLHDGKGWNIGALIVLNDVTRLRRLETVRRDFVANVSHELKTPITSIQGFAETLAENPPDHADDRRRFLEIILRQTRRIEAILGDLLSLTSLEHDAERAAVDFRVTRINDVLEEAVRSCESQAKAKGMRIDVHCDPGLAANANAPLLEHALINLLDNALKYGHPDTAVIVQCERAGDEIAIRVADHGPGVAPEHLPRLFERFYRVDTGRSRQLGGTGLGLAIVKRIARAHGGRVRAESRIGEGSTFSIFLPVHPHRNS